MARLFAEERECKREDVLRLVERYENGLRESELAECLSGCPSRGGRARGIAPTELEEQGLIYKEGPLWLAEE